MENKFLITESNLQEVNSKMDQILNKLTELQQARLVDEVLDRAGLAKRLNKHPNTIDKWASQGRITPYRIGGSTFYKLSEVLKQN